MAWAWGRRLAILAIFVAAVAVLAPASLVEAPLAARTQNRVRLSESTGFWWKGRGTLALGDGSARLPIAWRMELPPLLRGQFVTHVIDDTGGAARGTVTTDARRVEVRDAHVRIPAQIVGTLDPRMQGIALGGAIVVDAPALNLGDAPSGELRAAWERARIVAGETVIDLGTVSLAAAPARDGWSGTIGNTGGDVVVTGTVNARGSGADAALSLQPTAATPTNVRDLLPRLGSPDGRGGVRIAWRGERAG